jgi:acyl-coenzyme A synthetase/AMP-(fatty) acid ligase
VKPGTIGKPVAGFSVKVADDEGRELPAGEVGRLWVKGRSRAIGYWQQMDRTAEAFRGEWCVTGDLVVRDAEGYYSHCGRADEMLKVAGRWVAPQEVESCLLQHAAVAECAVVGAVEESGLVKPRAYVVARESRPGLEEELKAWVRDRLEAYKYPREVVFVDALPRTHLGKVDRGKLRRA